MKKKDDPMAGFLADLAATAKRTNAGTAVVSFRNCKAWGGGDAYVVYVAPGADRFDALKTIVDSMDEEPEAES